MVDSVFVDSRWDFVSDFEESVGADVFEWFWGAWFLYGTARPFREPAGRGCFPVAFFDGVYGDLCAFRVEDGYDGGRADFFLRESSRCVFWCVADGALKVDFGFFVVYDVD